MTTPTLKVCGREVVNARHRREWFYQNKTGWFHHGFDADGAPEKGINGPFKSRDEAVTDILWSTFRELQGPRPGGRGFQAAWYARWEQFKLDNWPLESFSD